MSDFIPLVELVYQADSYKNWNKYVALGIVSDRERYDWAAISTGSWQFAKFTPNLVE